MRTLILIFMVLALESSAYLRRPLFEGDPCDLKDGGKGECVPITKCPDKLAAVHSGTYFPTERCSFYKFTEIVCCHMSSNVSSTKVTFEIPFPVKQESPSSEILTMSTAITGTTTVDSRISDDFVKIRPAEKACYDFAKLSETNFQVLCTILGGDKADEGEVPYIAALRYKRSEGLTYECGGSLISTQHILTAAHCVSNDLFEVKLGSILRDITNEPVVDDLSCHNRTSYYVQNIPIAEAIVHPNYIKTQKYNDIAILKLAKQVSITKRVKPICLQYEGLHNLELLVNASQIQVAGWGYTEINGNSSDILMKTDLLFVDQDKCNQMWKNYNFALPRGIDADSMICMLGKKSGSDSCHGDSGGPVVKIHNNKIKSLIGLVSFGGFCGSAKPAIYTNVYHYLEWIEDIVWPK